MQLPGQVDGFRVTVVNEADMVANETLVLNRHAFANEGMAGYLTILSDHRILLDFDKRTDFSVIANRAAIEIDEPGELNVFAETDVWSNAH